MRKNITIYNHKKFAVAPGTGATNPQKPAQATNFKDVKYINRILNDKDATKIPGNLAILAIRAVWNDKLPTRDNFDKEVYGEINKVNQYAEFIKSLKLVKGIDQKKLADNFQLALDLITKKMSENTQLPAGPPMAGPGAGTGVTPSAQAPVLSPNQVAQQPQVTPAEADAYLTKIIPVLKTLSEDKSKPGAFTQRYSNEYNDVMYAMSILKSDPKFFTKLEAHNSSFKTLAPIYNNAMHPTGWSSAGNAVIVTDWYTLGDQIINDIQSSMIEKIEPAVKNSKIQNAVTKITTFQDQFLNKNPGNTDIAGVANKVNQSIDQYNIGKPIKEKLTRLK